MQNTFGAVPAVATTSGTARAADSDDVTLLTMAATSRLIADPAGSRILLAGDTHGNANWLHTLARLAARNGCDTILQLGDFGFWPAKRKRGADPAPAVDVKFLNHVALGMKQRGVRLRVIDGNHDDHPDARAAFEIETSYLRPVVDGVIDWADRGARWSWHGISFAALGGAVSTDRFHATGARTEGVDWWATEKLTADEVARLGGGHADVLVTHDAPAGVDIGGRDLTNPIIAADNHDHRALLAGAVRQLRPQLVVHGHHHQRLSNIMRIDDGVVRVEGLAHDVGGNGYSWAVLDLETLAVTDGVELSRQRQHNTPQRP